MSVAAKRNVYYRGMLATKRALRNSTDVIQSDAYMSDEDYALWSLGMKDALTIHGIGETQAPAISDFRALWIAEVAANPIVDHARRTYDGVLDDAELEDLMMSYLE